MEKINAPKGTKDIVYPEIEKWLFLENKIREFFTSYMYREIRTPIFEHSELFLRGIGSETEVVQKEMYTFKDKKERSLTLRPENTASVVRACLENNLLEKIFPRKFLYIGPMFRYDKPQKGRYRQFHQFGIEVFGDKSAMLDAEVVYSASSFIRSLGITGVSLLINSVGCKECRPVYLKKIEQEAEKKKEELCEDCKRKIHTNPLRIFDCKNKNCREAAKDFPKITDNLCEECSTHFADVKYWLDILGAEYIVDPLLVRGLDYYTKTAFEITSDKLGAQNALLGGGRYNDLVSELGGSDVTGIGFAGGMERILLHMDDFEPENTSVFIAFHGDEYKKDALVLLKEIAEKNYPVFMDYNSKNIKKQFKKGDRAGASFALILGEEEVSKKTVSVKNMKTFEQTTIKREELFTWLKENYR